MLFSFIKPISKSDDDLNEIQGKRKMESVTDAESSVLPLKLSGNSYEERKLFQTNDKKKNGSTKKRML